MNPSALLLTVLGGLGLFMLGIQLMTDGLKLAAGSALTRILREGTRTPIRGLLAGIAITALVQSSSAVTVAAIGFVNAGLLTLGNAVWVIFGSNIGTTTTGWVVALLGFQVKIEAFALPAIGLGMAMRLRNPRGQWAAIGQSVAGFGILFLGVSVLKESFAGLAEIVDPAMLAGAGPFRTLALVGTGVLLTTLMQSSSGAMTVALTVTASGLLEVTSGAAIVIGANLGTTTTALLATIGATPEARRLAASHVAFNLLAAAVALLLLPSLLQGIMLAERASGITPTPVITLALFHTAFNLLGLLVIAPVTPALIRWLAGKFVRPSEAKLQPKYLDRSVLVVPAVALEALQRELGHLGDLAIALAHEALSPAGKSEEAIRLGRARLDGLIEAIEGFVEALQSSALPAAVADHLSDLLLSLEYYIALADLAPTLTAAREARRGYPHGALSTAGEDYARQVCGLLQELVPPEEGPLPDRDWELVLKDLDRGYARLKEQILAASSSGALPPREMVRILGRARAARQAGRLAIKGLRELIEAGMEEG